MFNPSQTIARPIWIVSLTIGLALSLSTAGQTSSMNAPFLVTGAACNLGKAKPDGIRRLYWELYNLTELCVTVDVTTTPPTRVSLSFVLAYQGREVASSPLNVLVRAQTNTTTGLIEPRFDFGMPWGSLSLMTPQRDYQLTYPCGPNDGGCGFDGVVAAISSSELLSLSEADSLRGHALGGEFTVTSSGLSAIRTLAAVIERAPQ